MNRYYIWTIGCQMNKAESERLECLFDQLGYQSAGNAEQADLIILNGCVVRQNAEDKVINKLANLQSLKKKRPGITIAVTGCFVNSDTQRLREKFPQVDYFFKPGEFPPWIHNCGVNEMPTPSHPAVSTYVPIMQGCNNFCSYCIVPYRRGREKSRQLTDIISEVDRLANCGVKEVTLLGQNVDSYGQDLPDKPDLADLLVELNQINNLARIRFLTNHPKDMSPKLINVMAELDKVCEQLNLPVQAGDDHILYLMKRDYSVEHFRKIIMQIREKIPEIALSTDIIVGFPSETEKQFLRTRDLMAELKFDNVHMAAYSQREGTYAAHRLKDDIPGAEKIRRLEVMEKLQEKIATEKNARLTGRIMEVLVEGKKGGKWWGRTRTDKLAFFNSSKDCYGQLVNLMIEKTSPWSLTGTLTDG